MLCGAAFEMQIVDNQRAAVAVQFVHQRDSSADPSLKQRQRGNQQRPRLPESGLILEPKNARRTDRETAQDGLAMVRRSLRGALAQLAKLGSKGVIHPESLGKFLGHILALGAAGSEIHFLKDTKVPRFPHGGHDALEMLAAIDVPVEDSRRRVAGHFGGIASRMNDIQWFGGRGIGRTGQRNRQAENGGPWRNIATLPTSFSNPAW